MILVSIVGIISAFVMLLLGADLVWWIAAFIMFFVMSCLGITVTFHRYLSHRSFQFKSKWIERLFTLFGVIGATGSPLAWVAIHKQHHRFSDKEGDPHGPHLGWKQILLDYDTSVNYHYVKSFLKDPFHRFIHVNGVAIIIAYYIFLFILFGVNGLIFLGLIPQTMNILVGSISNHAMHYFGYTNFETKDDSRNVWWLALITWGESWHNNHHANPGKYTFQHKWWEIDISAFVIKIVGYTGR